MKDPGGCRGPKKTETQAPSSEQPRRWRGTAPLPAGAGASVLREPPRARPGEKCVHDREREQETPHAGRHVSQGADRRPDQESEHDRKQRRRTARAPQRKPPRPRHRPARGAGPARRAHSSVASMAICVVFVVITLVEATFFISSRTVALCVPMANSAEQARRRHADGVGIGARRPTSTASRKPVSTAHSNPKSPCQRARGRGARASTARTVVITPPPAGTPGSRAACVSAPCSLVTMATAASTKLPVTCATNSPNSARTVKLSMKPAAKLSSGGTDGRRPRCWRGTSTSLMSRLARRRRDVEPRRDPLHRLVHVRAPRRHSRSG